MTISEIMEVEMENTGNVILHKEGLFWRAYEHSAYLFHTQIRPLHLSSKKIKYIDKDIIYCGLPENSLAKLLESNPQWNPERDNKKITIRGFDVAKESFDIWKHDYFSSANMFNKGENVSKKADESKILDKLEKFPVLHKSPLECQQFIIELQKTLHGTL